MFLFSKSAIGLEIADRSIELVELSKKGSGFLVEHTARVPLPAGIVERGRIQNEEKLLQALTKGFTDMNSTTKRKTVIFGLPESQTYLHVFETTQTTEQELEATVQHEAKKSIPIPPDSLIISWRIIHTTKQKKRILIAATKREIIQEWLEFFKKARVTVRAFDTEALATFRGLFLEHPKDPVCVIDMGAATTHIALFTPEGLQHAYSIQKGGDTLTNEIVKTLNTSYEDAETMKKSIGLANPEGQAFQILLKTLGGIVPEIRQSFRYFEKQTGQKIGAVVLVGGTGAMKGLTEYFSANLSASVTIGKSAWIKKRVPLVFIQSVGLALRGIDKTWEHKDPVFTPDILVTTQASHKKEKPAIQPAHAQNQTPQPVYSPTQKTPNTDKLLRQKILLGVILVVGIIAVGGAFWFRSHEKTTQEMQQQETLLATETIEQPEQEQSVSNSEPSEPTPVENIIVEEAQSYVIIQDTPTGLLNVRSGPGITFEAFMEVLPQEEYVLLEEQENWYHIQIDEEITGWISSRYGEKVIHNQ